MTDSYKIRYLGTAEKDLIEIFEYIRRDNPSSAESQLDRFDSAIAPLTTHPFLGVIFQKMTGSKGLDTACWLWTGIWSFTLSRTIPYKYAESSMVPDNTAFSSDSKDGGIGVKDYPIRSRTAA